MDNVQQDAKRQPAVEVIEACSEWFVRVVAGDEEITRTFVLESFALAYAEGQRRRLGLPGFARIKEPSAGDAVVALARHSGIFEPADLELPQRVFDQLCNERRLAQKDWEQRDALAKGNYPRFPERCDRRDGTVASTFKVSQGLGAYVWDTGSEWKAASAKTLSYSELLADGPSLPEEMYIIADLAFRLGPTLGQTLSDVVAKGAEHEFRHRN